MGAFDDRRSLGVHDPFVFAKNGKDRDLGSQPRQFDDFEEDEVSVILGNRETIYAIRLRCSLSFIPGGSPKGKDGCGAFAGGSANGV